MFGQRLAVLIDRIRQGPVGELYRGDLVRNNAGLVCPSLRASQTRLLLAEPYCAYCPLCHPLQLSRPRTECKTCGDAAGRDAPGL